MKRTLLCLGSLLMILDLLAFSGCSKHSETVRRVEVLMSQKEYVTALGDLTTAIMQDPDNLELKRLQVELLVRYDRVDMAWEAYQNLQKTKAAHPGVFSWFKKKEPVDYQKVPDDAVLFGLLKDSDPKVRASAARVLGLVGTPNAIGRLQKLLSDSDRDVRRSTVSALGELRDSRATPGLIAALKDEWWFVRSDAAEGLGKIRDVTAVEPLFAALEDSDSSVRLAAENALLSLARKPDAPREVYPKYLQSGSAEVKRLALLSLAIGRDRSVVPQLIEMAASADPKNRAQATRALGIIQDEAGLPVLRKMLNDSEPMVRLQAIEALGEFKDVASAGEIKAMSESDSEIPVVRRAAAIALIKINQSQSTGGTTSNP